MTTLFLDNELLTVFFRYLGVQWLFVCFFLLFSTNQENPGNNIWPLCIGRILMATKDRVS